MIRADNYNRKQHFTSMRSRSFFSLSPMATPYEILNKAVLKRQVFNYDKPR